MWTACSKLAEPGTAVAAFAQSAAAAAQLQDTSKGGGLQPQRSQHLPERQNVELCLGLGWVAACARDATGSFENLGLEGKMRLFQICDPEGT